MTLLAHCSALCCADGLTSLSGECGASTFQFQESGAPIGHPCATLARPDGQQQQQGYEIWNRVTPGAEYIKLIVDLSSGCIAGAMLVSYSRGKHDPGSSNAPPARDPAAHSCCGHSDIEETIEHLMRDKIDVVTTLGGITMLDPNLDIEDFFD